MNDNNDQWDFSKEIRLDFVININNKKNKSFQTINNLTNLSRIGFETDHNYMNEIIKAILFPYASNININY